MARARRRYSNKFARSDAQVAVVDAATSQVSPRVNQRGPPKNIPSRLHTWPQTALVARPASADNQGRPGPQDTPKRSNCRPDTMSLIAPVQSPPCWSEDILIEVLSMLWLADLSPQERRAILRSVPLVCKHWLHACARIFSTSAYVVSARSDLFNLLQIRNLLGDPRLDTTTRTYTRQLPAPRSLPTYRHLDISRHLALGYQNTGCATLSGGRRTSAFPASLLCDAVDTFRHLEYMPNLSSIVLEYRAYSDKDATPLHRVTFRVIHIVVEYNLLSHPHPTQHWIAEELGLLPTSVSRAAKRQHLLNTLPDLNLVSFTTPQAGVSPDDPVILQAIGDMISMGAGSVSTSKIDDGRSIGVMVHGGLQGLEERRFALVHGALNKNTCVAKYPAPAPHSAPLPRRRRQPMAYHYNTASTLPPVPISVKGTALALVVNLGGVESPGSGSDNVYTGQREARIFSKRF